MTVASSFTALEHFIPLLDALGARGMSPDVSDSEPGVGEEQPHVPVYRRKRVSWRSSQLSSLLHNLDALYLCYRTRNGRRRNGNWPRVREADDCSVQHDDSVPVKHLPDNCYSRSWYETLDEDERILLGAERIRSVDLMLEQSLQECARFRDAVAG